MRVEDRDAIAFELERLIQERPGHELHALIEEALIEGHPGMEACDFEDRLELVESMYLGIVENGSIKPDWKMALLAVSI